MEDKLSYSSISIHPNNINIYRQTIGGNRSSTRSSGHSEQFGHNINTVGNKLFGESSGLPEQFKSNRHNGKISLIAKRKVKKALDYMLFLARPKKLPNSRAGKQRSFKLNFITLDLSSDQIHTDQVIKRELLHQFLIEMQRKWNVTMYLWKAEKQKNGRIHFHIITEKFIPWWELRNVWNRIQQKLGYVTRYREDRQLWHREGFTYNPKYAPRWDYKAQKKAYKEGLRTDWDNPNSIDIHGTRHIVNLKAYFSKEIAKNPDTVEADLQEERCPICSGTMATFEGNFKCDKCSFSKSHVSGMLWGCSVLLSNLPGARTDVVENLEEELLAIRESGKAYIYYAEYYSIYYVDHNVLTELKCKYLLLCFWQYIRQKFPVQYPPTLF